MDSRTTQTIFYSTVEDLTHLITKDFSLIKVLNHHKQIYQKIKLQQLRKAKMFNKDYILARVFMKIMMLKKVCQEVYFHQTANNLLELKNGTEIQRCHHR